MKKPSPFSGRDKTPPHLPVPATDTTGCSVGRTNPGHKQRALKSIGNK